VPFREPEWYHPMTETIPERPVRGTGESGRTGSGEQQGNRDMSEEHRNEEEPEIKVMDRRPFTADGELRDPDGAERSEKESPAEESKDSSDDKSHGFQHQPVEEPIGVDFSALTVSLAQSALFHLGEVPHPEGGRSQVNLEQAQVSIDFLALLKVKCRGNLSRAEEDHLDKILAELRLLFVRKRSVSKTGADGSEKG